MMAHNANRRRHILRSTSAQMNMFVDYMATNKDFATGMGEYAGVAGAGRADDEWEALRQQLKQHGADKSVSQWKLTWRDLKRRARKTLRDNKDNCPVVTDVTFKVLEAIGQIDPNVTEIQTTGSIPSENWEFESEENSLLAENEIENRNSGRASSKSSEVADEDMQDIKSVVEVIVPLPQVTQEYSKSTNKPQRDPLQPPVASMPQVPRLAPKPSTRSPSAHSAPRSHRVTSRTRHSGDALRHASQHWVALEHRRLDVERERDRRMHEREMERLKLELQRIEVQRNHNELLQHLVNIAQNAYELLQQKLH